MINKVRAIRRCMVGVCCLVVVAAASVPVQAVPIAPFPLASVEVERVIISPSHLILLSAVREVNDEIRSDSVIRLAVRGSGQRLQVSPDSGRDEARAYYRNELAERKAVVLFECQGRGCGRSNVWANQIFSDATLYGRDANQDYLAAAYRDQEGNVQVVLVYTVTRGNHREYVWVEQLTAEEGAAIPGFASASARIQGPIIVPWAGGVTYQFSWNANDRRLLQERSQGEGAKVVLNSYAELKDNETLESAMDRAEKAAEAMTVLLTKIGIQQQQIVPIIIGPAVEFGDPARQGDRVELVVVSQP
ncbi:DUF4892 domain-containing protein [Marinobacter caseinilyticus]|uniref:DUF4892 domain-containing protein n=1 Tax=Marinobacter caseinilyticus TaxID=2692195 RepID=UPI001F373914|nr:DUF4892 domain-containing protein [Marinobacter caseinilyticus]